MISPFAETFGGASFDVGASWLVPAHSDDGDDAERTVRGASPLRESRCPPGGASAVGRLWRDSAEFREGGLVADRRRLEPLSTAKGPPVLDQHRTGPEPALGRQEALAWDIEDLLADRT
jgi:hypothetical protein